MGFLDFFHRPTTIQDATTLADFIDRNAAFLIQKGMYEYSRARAGHYAKVLMGEPEFLEAIDKSRWQGFPLGLAMVGEMVEGVLRSSMGHEPRRQRDGLDALIELAPGDYATFRGDIPHSYEALEPGTWGVHVMEHH